MKRKIELYGRLRDLGRASVVVDLPARATVRDALSALKPAFGRALAGCVLATGDEVLASVDPLPAGRLALLPPVCGG